MLRLQTVIPVALNFLSGNVAHGIRNCILIPNTKKQGKEMWMKHNVTFLIFILGGKQQPSAILVSLLTLI
jgi:hypothetical protein